MYEEFPHEVEVQHLTTVRSPGGGYEETWTTLQNVTSQLAPITDDKRLEAMQEVNNLIYEWFVPYETVQELRATLDVAEGDPLSDVIRVKDGAHILELRGHGKDLGGMQEIVEFTLRLITP